jgi:dephospho-CoA kinase
MFLVGLTGGIGSGKSTASALLAERGAEVVDADEIAREVVLPGKPAYDKIIEHFGSDVLDDEGFIDRPQLGAVVFREPSKRTLLNELTHPRVFEEIASRLEVLQAFDGVVVLDVPLLVESGVERGYDAVVVVATQLDTQVRRLAETRGMTEEESRSRIAAQAPLEAKLAVATHVVWNEGSLEELRQKVDELGDELFRLAEEKSEREQQGIPND